MGYRRKATVFNLKFEDPEMDGLVVKARSPSMGEMFDVMNFRTLAFNPERMDEQNAERLRDMFEFFGTFLIEWNLETEQGEAVPCDVSGLLSQDHDFVLAVVMAWLGVVGSVARPLGAKSNGGPPSAVESIPMELLSENPANSLERS